MRNQRSTITSRSESQPCFPQCSVPTACTQAQAAGEVSCASQHYPQHSSGVLLSPSRVLGLSAVHWEAKRRYCGPSCSSITLLLPQADIPSLEGDLLLESFPVSVVMFKTDFCSRLVGWGDKTALSVTTWTECFALPTSSQSFQEAPSFVSSPYLLIHLCNLRFCIAFGIVLCRKVSTKWPRSPKSSAFFIYLPHLP